MAETQFASTPAHTIGDLPTVGSKAPTFETVGADLSVVTAEAYAGKRIVLNVFPSVDTGICATSVRKFNELAAGLDNTVVVTVSKDLPFALGRFCGAEGIDDVVVSSAFRSSFGEDYGVTLLDSPLAGLLARSVFVIGTDGTVLHSQLVPEIKQEPDYDAAIAALQ